MNKFGKRSLLNQQTKDIINWQDLGILSQSLIKIIGKIDYVILEEDNE